MRLLSAYLGNDSRGRTLKGSDDNLPTLGHAPFPTPQGVSVERHFYIAIGALVCISFDIKLVGLITSTLLLFSTSM